MPDPQRLFARYLPETPLPLEDAAGLLAAYEKAHPRA